MFVKITNGQSSKYPYTLGELRRDNPQISFPKQIPDAVLAEYGVYPVVPTAAPIPDSKTHRVSQSVENVDGSWQQVWRVLELPVETASANVRAHRNRLLSETDWTQVDDAPVDKGAWAIYRQSLRDITSQTNFPHNIVWPTKPE